jgi:hypothetical protein
MYGGLMQLVAYGASDVWIVDNTNNNGGIPYRYRLKKKNNKNNKKTIKILYIPGKCDVCYEESNVVKCNICVYNMCKKCKDQWRVPKCPHCRQNFMKK